MASSPVLWDEYIPARLSDEDRYITSTTSTLEGALSTAEVQLRPTNLAFASQLEESVKLEVRAHGKPPDWLAATARAFDVVLALPPRWNSYAARPVNVAAVEGAFVVLTRIMTETTPPPVIVPTVSGGVQLEWHESGVELEIAVYPDRRVEVLFEDLAEGLMWEGTFPEAQTIIAGAIRRISAE